MALKEGISPTTACLKSPFGWSATDTSQPVKFGITPGRTFEQTFWPFGKRKTNSWPPKVNQF